MQVPPDLFILGPMSGCNGAVISRDGELDVVLSRLVDQPSQWHCHIVLHVALHCGRLPSRRVREYMAYEGYRLFHLGLCSLPKLACDQSRLGGAAALASAQGV